MISLYTGSVGSGKSYHATHLGLNWIQRKHVIANFPIKPPSKFLLKRQARSWQRKLARWIFWDEITVEMLIAMSIEKGWYGKESQCLLIIDEAGIEFNSRDWQTDGKKRTKWIKFLSQSRKFGYDIVFVVQADRMIDKQIRGLVEYEVKHLKANNSFFLSFLSMFRVTLFMYVYRWYQTKLRANIRFGRYKKSVANRYDTMRTFNLDDLIGQIEAIYKDTVMPESVAKQLDIWRAAKDSDTNKVQGVNNAFEDLDTKLDQAVEMTAADDELSDFVSDLRTGLDGGVGVPSSGSDADQNNSTSSIKQMAKTAWDYLNKPLGR